MATRGLSQTSDAKRSRARRAEKAHAAIAPAAPVVATNVATPAEIGLAHTITTMRALAEGLRARADNIDAFANMIKGA